MKTVYTDITGGESQTLADGESFESAAVQTYAYEGNAAPAIGLQITGAGTVTVETLTRHKVGGDFLSESDPNYPVEDLEALDDGKVYRINLPVCLAFKLNFVATGAVVITMADLTTFYGA